MPSRAPPNCSQHTCPTLSNSSQIKIEVRAWLARGYFIPGSMSQRGFGQTPMVPCRTLSDQDLGQTSVPSHITTGFDNPNNCSNKPHPHAQNRSAIAIRPFGELPKRTKIEIFGNVKTQRSQQVSIWTNISTSNPVAEILDGADGSALKN